MARDFPHTHERALSLVDALDPKFASVNKIFVRKQVVICLIYESETTKVSKTFVV